MENRRFVDTPEAKGDESATARRLAKCRRQNVKLKFYVGLTSSLVLLLALGLASALWSSKACAASTDVHPARPGYSRVLPASEPSPYAANDPKDRQVVLKPAQPHKEEHKTNLALMFTATVAWIWVLIVSF